LCITPPLEENLSGGLSYPPKHFGENCPALLGAQRNCFVCVIFRLKHFGVIETSKTGHR